MVASAECSILMIPGRKKLTANSINRSNSKSLTPMSFLSEKERSGGAMLTN